MLFDPGSDLNVVGGHDDVRAGLAVGRASALQILVDDEADDDAPKAKATAPIINKRVRFIALR
jgi:hypothetical protein